MGGKKPLWVQAPLQGWGSLLALALVSNQWSYLPEDHSKGLALIPHLQAQCFQWGKGWFY